MNQLSNNVSDMKFMQRKAFVSIAILISFVMFIEINRTVAEAPTSFSATPTNFVISENDLGQKSTITLSNLTNNSITLAVKECIAQKVDGDYQETDNSGVGSSIEILSPSITLKANAQTTLTPRVRISASSQFEQLKVPCVKIVLPKTSESMIIPFIVQNLGGNVQIGTTLDIHNTGVITSSDLKIDGTISNSGGKFFFPQGNVTITKDGKTLFENDLSSQIGGLMLPGESKSFNADWTDNLSTINSIGEYTVTLRVTNDQNGDTTGKEITYMYINSDVLLLGSIALGTILLISIGVVILKRK